MVLLETFGSVLDFGGYELACFSGGTCTVSSSIPFETLLITVPFTFSCLNEMFAFDF